MINNTMDFLLYPLTCAINQKNIIKHLTIKEMQLEYNQAIINTAIVKTTQPLLNSPLLTIQMVH